MGYEMERFVSDIDDTLICSVCYKVYENPKMLSLCRHVFCFGCIEKNVINGNMCPLDQNHIDSSHVEEAPKSILDYLSALRIKCDFQKYGCNEAVLLNGLLLHRLNCQFHPERRVKCNDCGIEIEKLCFKDHNCVSILKNRLDVMSIQMEELKNLYSQEILNLKTQMQRQKLINAILEAKGVHFGPIYGEEGVNTQNVYLDDKRPMISFSCVTDTQSGTNELIFIRTPDITLECEVNRLSKVGMVKYHAASIANLNTTDYSLYSKGIRLEDDNYLSYYNIHNPSICHLLPNEVYIIFDCVDIRQILGLSVRTCDTIKAIIRQLNQEIRKLVPEQLFLYIEQCSCALYYNDTKLEETYELLNYNVLFIRTLKYYNRLPIDV